MDPRHSNSALARREGTSTVWNLTRTFGNRDAVIQEIMMAHARQTVAERNQPRD